MLADQRNGETRLCMEGQTFACAYIGSPLAIISGHGLTNTIFRRNYAAKIWPVGVACARSIKTENLGTNLVLPVHRATQMFC